MSLWKTTTWSPLDIACLKWSSLLVGVAVGAFLAPLPQAAIWILLIVAVVLAIKPTKNYLRST